MCYYFFYCLLDITLIYIIKESKEKIRIKKAIEKRIIDGVLQGNKL